MENTDFKVADVAIKKNIFSEDVYIFTCICESMTEHKKKELLDDLKKFISRIPEKK